MENNKKNKKTLISFLIYLCMYANQMKRERERKKNKQQKKLVLVLLYKMCLEFLPFFP